MIGSTIGSFPMVTLGMWRGMSARQRLAYRVARHPLTIFFGYIPVFLIGFALSPFFRNGKKHWGGPVALAIHFTGFSAAVLFLGWITALLFLIVPTSITLGLGTYLFYAQHNFPDIQLRGRRDWEYSFAALRSSSMFDMPPLMHWFTGNIGYHHVHHLNHQIPFYRLPEAMAGIPELQTPGRTSWHWRDVRACLALAVWDPDQNRMLTYSELRSKERDLVHAG
jgi:omega-6 fatty acid desaturase (delta-12 desaturase)